MSHNLINFTTNIQGSSLENQEETSLGKVEAQSLPNNSTMAEIDQRNNGPPIVDARYTNEIEQSLAKEYSLIDLPNLIKSITGVNVQDQHHGMIGIRKILSTNGNYSIQKVVEARIMEYIRQNDYPQLRLQAAWVLRYIISDTNTRDKIINEKGLLFLVQAIGKIQQPITIIHQYCCWTLATMCRGNPLPKHDHIKQAISLLCRAISKLTIRQGLAECYWAICDHTYTNKDVIHIVIESKVVPNIINSLEGNEELIIPSIQILGNVTKVNEQYKNQLIQRNVLERLLNHEQQIVRRQCCRLISNIAAGNKQTVGKLLVKEDIIQKIINMFKEDENEIKMQICSIFSNLTRSGDAKYILELYKQKQIVNQYLHILSSDRIASSENVNIKKQVLQCLFVILVHQQKNSGNSETDIKRQNHIKAIRDILEDFCSVTKKEQQKFNQKIINSNYYVQKFLEKKAKIRLLGKANAEISYLDKIKGKIDHPEEYCDRFNPKSIIDKNFALTAIKYLKNGEIYQEDEELLAPGRQFVHLAFDDKSYDLFFNGEEIITKDQLDYFKDKLRASDVIQGKKQNDCYLLAAVAALTDKYSKLIFRLFSILKNTSHIYGVRLFIEGKWQTVTLDVRFPILGDRTLFAAKRNDLKIWPLLLQKAYAKIYGSYKDIGWGFNKQGIQILTGAPSCEYTTDIENFQQIIENEFKQKSIITAALVTDKFTNAELKKLGLVGDHAYSILNIFPKVVGSVTLIKARNPWGRKEGVWNSAWNTADTMLWTEQLRKTVGNYLNNQDGSFFMCVQDFKTYFQSVNICRVEQSNTNSWLNIKCPNGQFSAIAIKITQKGRYSFTLYLKGKRLSQGTDKISWLFLLKKQGKKTIPIFSNCIAQYNNTLQNDKDLDKGEYLILVKVNWSYKKQQQYCLSSYGPKQVWMQPVQYNQCQLKKYIQQSYLKQDQRQFQYQKDNNQNILKRRKFYPKLGYGFIQIMNFSQTSNFDIQIKFGKNVRQMIVLSPYNFPLHLQMGLWQTVKCNFVITCKFNVKSPINFTCKQINSISKSNENGKFDSNDSDMSNNYNLYFQIKPDEYAITKLILKSVAIKNGLIEKKIINDILKDMKSKNEKRQQQSSDTQEDENNKKSINQQPQYQIEESKQGNKLGQALSQISCIDRLKYTKSFNNLKEYLNDTSKLDQEFARKAAKTLINKVIYKEKYVPCFFAINWIMHGQSNKKYSFFFDDQKNIDKTERKSKLEEWIKSNDIIQGKINDSYFLSAMAALANRHPQMLFSLFVILRNPSNIYGVRLFIEGKWHTVPIDLQFPIDRCGDFCGAQPNGKKIWPMMIQKAYAKLNGSYDKINMGTGSQGIQLLTGAPSIYYQIKKPYNIWELIQRQFNQGSILTASLIRDHEKTKISQFQQLSQKGLTPNHSYTILNFQQYVHGSAEKVSTHIRLRSPQSDQWDMQSKEKSRYILDPKDCSFSMPREDFEKYFSCVYICRAQQQNKNSWLDLQCKNDEFMVLNLKIEKRGKYFLTLYLKGRRQFPKDKIYEQRCSWLFLLKKQNTKFQRVCCSCIQKHNNTLQSDELDTGEYRILLKVKWNHDISQLYRLAIYGPQQVSMQVIQPFEKSYLNDYFQYDFSKQFQETEYVQYKSKRILSKIKFYSGFGYGLIQIKNQQEFAFEAQIQFRVFQKYTNVLLDQQPSRYILVPPKQQLNRKFISIPRFQQKYMRFKEIPV